jgi:hypothetical protein
MIPAVFDANRKAAAVLVEMCETDLTLVEAT